MQELQAYINAYPQYRLTVIQPNLRDHENFTFTGADYVFDDTEPRKNTIYLVYDASQNHFGACPNGPTGIFQRYHNTKAYRWCHKCTTAHTDNPCNCDGSERRKKKPRIQKTCAACGMINCAGGVGGCSRNCTLCGTNYKTGFDLDAGEGHRCIVYTKPGDIQQFWQLGDDKEVSSKDTKYMLWAYDLESAVKRTTSEEVIEFDTTVDGDFLMDPETGLVRTTLIEPATHDVNMVVFRNVFDPDSEQCFFGNDALDRFVTFMLNTNHGKNVCVAHNGSGYDSRLVFECLLKYKDNLKMVPISRGCKFMQLTADNTIFRDSMLHLPGT